MSARIHHRPRADSGCTGGRTVLARMTREPGDERLTLPPTFAPRVAEALTTDDRRTLA
ncbi:hypothetical protein [Streptomyces sp. NPDC001652]|uniref:hypothetical protein n=1 Tax=Streptomyces sp. NPDC001652 TaxID=3154393 RepID=UPI00331FB24A